MARAQKLKVYRTPIGFHDAYVAAPSQKAALAAWGSTVDLFARGVAEVVEDEALKAEPLASPGKVIRRSRGSAEDQLAALPPDPPRKAKPPEKEVEDSAPLRRQRSKASPARRVSGPTRPLPRAQEPEPLRQPEPRPQPKPKPRPSRMPLGDAEQALEALVERQRREAADLHEQEQSITRLRREADRRHERERAEAEQKVERARRAYADALSRS